MWLQFLLGTKRQLACAKTCDMKSLECATAAGSQVFCGGLRPTEFFWFKMAPLHATFNSSSSFKLSNFKSHQNKNLRALKLRRILQSCLI